MPTDFAPGVVVEIVHEVRQVANPERPRDDAYQGPDPQYPLARVLERQRPGYEVYLLESRVVDGRQWWRIADSAAVGCCAPFGWIPALTADGSPVFRMANVICPAADGALTSYDLFRIGGFDPAVCHGNREITLRGYLACNQPSIDAPYFLSGLRSYDQTGYECTLDERLTVYGEIVPDSSSGTSANEWRDVVDLTGHYFAAESDACRWTTGNFMHMPVDGAPVDTAQFACRMRFYGTGVTRLP
jgi:hypothetical protein